MPILSIIIPAYNSDRFIAYTLSMLVSQGLDDCEVIIVNDGSIDNTETICSSFTKQYPEIRQISIPNSGVSVARNSGLEYAIGDYIYFLDSDDILPPGTLSFFKETVKRHNEVDVFTFGYESRKNGRCYRKYINPQYLEKQFNNPIEFLRLFFSKTISCNICSVIISHSFLNIHNVLFTPGIKIGEDVEFLINIFSRARSFFYSRRVCFIYQIHNDSVMQGYKGYSKYQFNSFILISNLVEKICIGIPIIEREARFFLAFLYVSHLKYFLCSKYIDINVNQQLVKYRRFIYYNMRGNYKWLPLIWLLRLVPLKILYFLFCKI